MPSPESSVSSPTSLPHKPVKNTFDQTSGLHHTRFRASRACKAFSTSEGPLSAFSSCFLAASNFCFAYIARLGSRGLLGNTTELQIQVFFIRSAQEHTKIPSNLRRHRLRTRCAEIEWAFPQMCSKSLLNGPPFCIDHPKSHFLIGGPSRKPFKGAMPSPPLQLHSLPRGSSALHPCLGIGT